MNSLLLWPVLNELSFIGLTFAFLSVVFFFFYVKEKFKKTATVKAYSILFFAFIFHTLAAFSFVFLHALNAFFHIGIPVFESYLWFLPFSLTIALLGAFIAFLLYFIGQKLFKENVFKAMNLSLLILLPCMIYYLFFWPYLSIAKIIMEPLKSKQVAQVEINVNGIGELNYKAGKNYFSAAPSQLFDSLAVTNIEGNRIQFVNNANGYSYFHQIPISSISQIYIAPIPHYKQIAILALSPAIEGNSVLFICDSLGTKIYQNKFEGNVNRMSISEDGKYLLLQKPNELDSLVFYNCLKLKP